MGEGPDAEWLGSIPWDGYPDGIDRKIFQVVTESDYRNAVALFLIGLGNQSGATMPDQGWPWSWNDSSSTHYAYAWLDGKVWGSTFGSPWFLVQPDMEGLGEPDEAEDADVSRVVVRGMPSFPDMRDFRKTYYLKIPNPRVTQEG